MSLPRVLVMYNEPTLANDHPDADSEHDILYTADTICRILQTAGLPASRLGITHDPAAVIAGVKSAAPDVVFNLYEGTAGWGNAEAFVSGILELLRVPFTGCPTQPLLLCRSKPLTKRLLAGAGLPTAPFMVIETGAVPTCTIDWPVIVKPGTEDASVGIDQRSVATNQQELETRVAYLREKYGPSVLVEKFVRGREFNVALVERDGVLTPLPFSEILFVPPADKPDLWPIVSFDAKWRPGTVEFTATPAKNPAENVPPEMQEALSSLAKKAFELVGCRDYARVDFRVDEAGQPYVLEVNPNPCISPLAGLAAGLETARIPYSEFILGLVRSALQRGSRPELAEVVGRLSQAPGTAPNEPASKPMRLAIRPARRSDAGPVADLVDAIESWSADDRRRSAERVTELLVRRNRGDWQCFVTSGKSGPLGVVSVRPIDSVQGAFAVDLFAVAPSRRRNGIGRRLLRAAEEAVGQAGGRFLIVEVSSGPNAGPIRQFLQKLEYRLTGEVSEYFRDGYSRLTYLKPVTQAIPIPTEPAPIAAITPR